MIRGCWLCVLLLIQVSVGFAQATDGEPPDPAQNVLPETEPVADEPSADAPAADEPSADAPAADEPSADAPAADAPAADAPAADAPAADAPAADAPTADAAAIEQRLAEEDRGPADVTDAAPESASPVATAFAALEFSLRADQPGRLRFESESIDSHEFSAPGRATLEPAPYQVTWTPSGGEPELLDAAWRPNGEPLRVAHRGPSFTNLMGYWLLANGLLVGVPVSLGVFAKREDLGAAATFSIIGVNTLVAIAGAIFMGIGDDEVVELEQN